MNWKNIKELKSTDTDVKKYIFTKEDAIAEAVLYKYGSYSERTVMCISTQTGCPMGCTFCGTGKFFGRDLTAGEITSQVYHMVNSNKINIEQVKSLQIMVMSMGEPLLNSENLYDAFNEFSVAYPDAKLLISTSAPKTQKGWSNIMKMATEIESVGLQFSVHESSDDARDKVMPMKSKLSLEEIALMGLEFYRVSGRKPFFNYCVHDKNKSNEDISRLRMLFDPRVWEATLSVICEHDESMRDAVSSQLNMVSDFSERMVKAGFNTRVFDPAGQDDIGGGCGQLWAVQDFAKNNKHFKQSAGNKISCKNT